MLSFGQTYMKFEVDNLKNDGHASDISKFQQEMKKKQLKVSAP